MKVSEFSEVLNDFNDVFVLGDGGEIEIQPQMVVVMSKDGSDYTTKVGGYIICLNGKEKKVKPQKLIKKLEKLKAVGGDEVRLAGIGSQRLSYEKYLAGKDFEKIDMQGLIDKYGGIADRFSLTCPYNTYGEKGRILYKISEELSKDVADKTKQTFVKLSREQYDVISEEDKAKLQPFEKLYAEIGDEFELFYEKKRDFAEQNDGNVFFCDEFGRGKTRYTSPMELWHVYSGVEQERMCLRLLDKMKASENERPLDEEILNDSVLKNNLVDIEAGFAWHCTLSGELSKTFYFELNEQTKKWLLKHKNDYDFDDLQDLAFYDKDKLLFSSCTHEGFHTDLTEKH